MDTGAGCLGPSLSLLLVGFVTPARLLISLCCRTYHMELSQGFSYLIQAKCADYSQTPRSAVCVCYYYRKGKKDKVKRVHQNCSNLGQNIICVIREVQTKCERKQDSIQ